MTESPQNLESSSLAHNLSDTWKQPGVFSIFPPAPAFSWPMKKQKCGEYRADHSERGLVGFWGVLWKI